MNRGVALYTFKRFCDESPLEKEILECGAGVFEEEMEPLFGRFAQDGYRVHGIDIAEGRLANARAYCKRHNVEADLRRADLLELPFEDACMPFVYAYDVVIHGRKTVMRQMVAEMIRVLQAGGLMFVNFLALEDDRREKGQEIGEGEYLEQHGGHDVVHNYLQDTEAEAYFEGLELLFKEKRVTWKIKREVWRRQASLDYILKKP